MFSELKCGIGECIKAVRYYPIKVFGIPSVLIICALFIRLFGDGTHTIYLALDGKGIFPGAFLYTFGYLLRIGICGLSLSSALFCVGLFEERGKAVLLCTACCLVMLFEYRMIFISMSIFFEIMLCIVSIAASVITLMIFFRTKCIGAFSQIIYILLSLIFLIQLFSLIIFL